MAKYIGQLLGWKKDGDSDILNVDILQEGSVSEVRGYVSPTLRIRTSFWEHYLEARIKNYKGKVKVVIKEGTNELEEFDFLDMTEEEKHPSFHYESLEKRIEAVEKAVRK